MDDFFKAVDDAAEEFEKTYAVGHSDRKDIQIGVGSRSGMSPLPL